MKKVIVTALIVVAVLFQLDCDRNDQKRKIKLSEQAEVQDFNQKLTTTIRLEPKERRTIAVMFFQNLTGDQNLEWLKKGLTEMLIRTLSQSSHLSILTTDRLVELVDRHAATRSSEDIDLDIAAFVGREANVEAVLVGQIKSHGGNLIFSVKLKETDQGFILKEENVEGKSIDAIFSMVDELTEKVKRDLQLTFEKAEAIRGISEISTNNLDAWREFSMGRDLVDKYLHNDAIPHFERAVALDSNFAAAILDLYPMYRNTRENNKAMQLFKKLIELKPHCTRKDQFEIDLFEANLNNDDLKFLETLEQWLIQFPEDRDAYMRMADVYRSWNNAEAEIRNLEKILAIDPNYKIAYNRLGYANANDGNFEQAMEAIRHYIKLAPDEANPYDSAGEIHMLFGEYDKAEKYFKQALAINDSYLHSIIYLGNLYLFKGNYKQALKLYQKNLEKASNEAEKSDAHFRLGNTYLILGEKEIARKNYEAALKSNPYNFNALDLLKEASTTSGDSAQINDLKKKTYNDLKRLLNSETERERALNSLVWLSIVRDVNRSETIDILNYLIQEFGKSANPSVVLYLTNLKFMLTLLYGKTEQYDRIDSLWVNQEIIPPEFWRFLKDAHNNSFSDNWRFFGQLNELFYHEITQGVEFYTPLVNYAHENEAQSMEMMFRLLVGNLHKFANDTLGWEQERKYVGVPPENKWMVIGPFEYKDGFRRRYPPERKINLNKIYKDKSGMVRWQHSNDGMEDGFIQFNQIFEKANWKVGYGLIFIDSPDEREVQFRFGTDDGSKLWLNDQEIWKLNRTNPAIFDLFKRTVTLKKGMNKVLIKVFNTVGDWGFFFRVTDEQGIGAKGITFVSADEN